MDLQPFFAWAAARWKYLAVAVLATCYCAVAVFVLAPPSPLTAADANDYIVHLPYRLSGYPLFLKLFGLDHIMLIQSVIFSACMAYLGIEIVRQSKQLWMAVVVMLLVFSNRYVSDLIFSIASEALFLPALCLLLGGIIRFADRPSVLAAISCGTAIGLACTARPTGWAFLVAAVLLLALVKSGSPRRLVILAMALIIPMMALVGAEQVYNRTIHPKTYTSLAGPHLFGKAAMLEPPSGPGSYAPGPSGIMERWIDTDYASARALVRGAPNAASRARLRMAYETCAADHCGDDARSRTGLSQVEANRISFKVGLERIQKRPFDLLALDWADYWSLWEVFHDPSLTPAFNTYMSAHTPAPYQQFQGNRMIEVPKSRIGGFGNAAMMAVAIALLASSFSAVWMAIRGKQASSGVVIAVISAAVAQGVLAMTALTAPAISRFVLGVWPAVAVAAVYNAVVVWPMVRTGFSLAASRWRAAPDTIAAPV